MLSWICAIAAGLLTACEPAQASEQATEVHAPPPRAIVRTTTLEEKEVSQKIGGFATVMSPDQLISLDAEIRSATIARKFSEVQFDRFSKAPSLSLLTIENAERLFSSDTAQLALHETRLRQVYGDAAPFLGTEKRAKIIEELTTGGTALVRLDFASRAGTEADPHNVRVTPLAGGPSTPVSTLWAAPSGNQAMPGASYYGLISTGPGLKAGDRAQLEADTASRTGVVIPNASIIVSESKSWCYVETAPGNFERKEVSLEIPVAEGYLVESGFAPGMKVVVNGASTLLARESEPILDDDDGEKPAPAEKRSDPDTAGNNDPHLPRTAAAAPVDKD